ncbi:Protein of uncharacterised function (DUF1493) [Serratia ficaria]|uniref:DUF1493 family protein n=1 Tax=Serratia ficaria TaxID=61651 RepID=UPI00217A15F3|nr:DUF1493 family protein [Serratia ficaria]CAI1179981.1 Protein of uncharacterised function (DUF1493) [Serratia ficaria]CAI1788504.1 Protein of uncharacterised function (DUF1493) [Serratia ficaria]CAI2420699.1 Protein of uncharacterised function (DUF1493) [Serratia ficaria]CAI2496902.1 Protein of uncharacterised function (DUF1493) [Serratia ficaria]CAI2537690.1 Protein of uncharacterised function (DUF1493) [Serratia ficaria]
MDDIDNAVFKLIREHSPYGDKRPITKETDFRSDLRMIWEDVNDMMGEYFEKFHIEPGEYELITYFPKQQPLRPLLRLFGVAKAEPPPKLTAGMLIESAKAGRWLY